MHRCTRCGPLLLIGMAIVGMEAGSTHAETRSLSLREAVALALSEQGNPQVRQTFPFGAAISLGLMVLTLIGLHFYRRRGAQVDII